jgi:carboxyl-terminal processing protease
MTVGRLPRVAVAVASLVVAFGAGAATVLAVDSGPGSRPPVDRAIDQAVTTIETHAAHPVPSSALEQAAVQGMLTALDDRWATYYDTADFRRFQQVLGGGYTGIGLWLERDAAGALRVLSVQPDSPAARAGVRHGDRIIAVQGQSVTGEAVATVTDRLRGRAGTDVELTLASSSGSVRELRLRRAAVADDDVTTSMLPDNVERIRISAFTAGVGVEVRNAVAAAQRRDLDGIVLDLRDNPGGLLDEAVETASAFLSRGPVVSYVQRGQSPRTLDALGGGNTSLPLVVLVDGGTASAAEIVAAALQDRGRAVLLGSQTFGKGTVQAPQRLAGGGAIELTVGHYLTPSGQSLEHVGITPDVLIPPRDPESVVDSRALEVLSGLTADAGSSGRG